MPKETPVEKLVNSNAGTSVKKGGWLSLAAWVAVILCVGLYALLSQEDENIRQIPTTEKPVAHTKVVSTKRAVPTITTAEKLQVLAAEIEAGLFAIAIKKFSKLKSELTSTDLEQIEQSALQIIKPIPADKLKENQRGYAFLGEVRPDKPEYLIKAQSYRDKIKARKAARQKSLLANMRITTDKIAKVTFYAHKKAPKYRSSRTAVAPYIGKSNGQYYLRMRVQYTASSWLFVEEVMAFYDGISHQLISGEFQRDHDSSIWEWNDVTPDTNQIYLMRSLAKAKESILRFKGSQYHSDFTLKARDKQVIRQTLELYDMLIAR